MSVSERGVEERCGLGDDEVQAVEVLLTELVLRHRLGLAYLGDGRRSFRLSATKSQAARRSGHRTWSNSTNVDSRHVDGSDAGVLEDTWTRDIVRCSGGLRGVCGRLRFWLSVSAEYMLYGAAIGCILLNVGGTFC